MNANATNLIWIDLEMTGLIPERHRIIEIAILVTDPQLEIVAAGPLLVVHQPDEVLEAMDSWNKNTHKKTGLIERVRASPLAEADVERRALEFVGEYVPPASSPMCGNSICQDRRFLARWMPQLESHFHYRNLDVSTPKELCTRWAPQIAGGFSKESAHLAMSDIHDSIAELRYYRQNFLRPDL